MSCLMGTYGHERYIERALDALLAQDYPADALEIVVVDDGSPDRTPELVEPYLDRIRYIRKPNAGLLDTVNRGLAECSGEYIAFFSGDDESPPRKISRQVELLEARPEVGLCYGDMEMIDASGATIAPSFFAAHGLRPRRGRVLGALLHHNFVSGGSMMVRGSLREAFHPLPSHAAWEDWWIALRVAEVAELDYLDEPLSRYRIHDSNLAGSASGDKLATLQREEIRFRRWLLRTVDSAEVSAAELTAAVAMLQRVATQVSEQTGDTVADIYAAEPADRAAAAELVHDALDLAHDDPEAGLRLAVRALGHDPASGPALATLQALDGACAAHASLAREVDDLLAGVRPHATLAFADELAATPALLAGYAGAFEPSDPATLVIYAPGADPAELEGTLLRTLADVGVDDARCPDLLAAVTRRDPDVAGEIARRMSAVLTERPLPHPFASLPLLDLQEAPAP